MRGRVPKWLIQVIGGLSDGKDWLVDKYRGLPSPIRASGWLVFQAVLFKLQPKFWHGLVAVVELMAHFRALNVRTHLLLLVVLLLVGHAAFVVPKLNSLHTIVKNMDNSSPDAGEAVADGGTKAKQRRDDELSPSGAGAISGAIAGVAFGLVLGPPWIIGLAVLGAMVGDEWEQRVLDD